MDKRRSILMIHGTDYISMVKELLEKADIASEIPGPDAEIALKPNLVTDSDPSRGGTPLKRRAMTASAESTMFLSWICRKTAPGSMTVRG